MAIFPFLKDVGYPYCGPTAIAHLTGVPYSRAEHMIRRRRRGGFRDVNGRRIKVKGTYASEVIRVLKALGCKVAQHKTDVVSFASFVEDVRHAGTFLVEVTGHWMVCDAGMIADTTCQTPVAIADYHKKTRRVRRAWKVVAPIMPKYTADDALVASRAPKPKKDVKLARAEKVAADVKRWERKEKLAKTKLKKLRASLKRYQKAGVIGGGK